MENSAMIDEVREIIAKSIDTKRRILESEELCKNISIAAEMLINTYKNDGKVLLCGNGGSASDAQHIEGELVGRFQMERRALPAIALASSGATMTAIGNDYSYADVFSRQVAAHGNTGDILIGISTSGNSASVIRAVETAKNNGMTAIALLGRDGGACKSIADVTIIVPSDVTARIQECHIMIGHIWCGLIEDALFRNSNE